MQTLLMAMEHVGLSALVIFLEIFLWNGHFFR